MASVGSVKMNLIGADELASAFAQVSYGLKNRVIKRALTKAARVMVPRLRSATPKSKKKFGEQAQRNPPGTLRKSTGLIIRKYRGGAVQAAYVGHRWPKGAAAHLVDAGTTERTLKPGLDKLGRRKDHTTGRVAGRKFFKPVYESTKQSMESVLKTELTEGLVEERQKAGARSVARAARR